ncbi:MAG: hypothetical protein ACHQFW_09570, partial [Chitinophagales bacterium]
STFFINAVSASIYYPVNPLFNHWQLAAVVVDGIEVDPDAAMADDVLYINEDNTAQSVLSGVSITGTWTIDDTNTYLTIVSTDMNNAVRLKITSVTDLSLTVERYDSAGNVTVLLFEPE